MQNVLFPAIFTPPTNLEIVAVTLPSLADQSAASVHNVRATGWSLEETPTATVSIFFLCL